MLLQNINKNKYTLCREMNIIVLMLILMVITDVGCFDFAYQMTDEPCLYYDYHEFTTIWTVSYLHNCNQNSIYIANYIPTFNHKSTSKSFIS